MVNGGWVGGFNRHAWITPLNRGFATGTTYDGNHGGTYASFAIGHPEKLIDFGYHGAHETARQLRIIVDAFYGKPTQDAYFVGCPEGGPEALMEAKRFP